MKLLLLGLWILLRVRSLALLRRRLLLQGRIRCLWLLIVICVWWRWAI